MATDENEIARTVPVHGIFMPPAYWRLILHGNGPVDDDENGQDAGIRDGEPVA